MAALNDTTAPIPDRPVSVTLIFPSSKQLFLIGRKNISDASVTEDELRLIIRDLMLSTFSPLFAPHGATIGVRVEYAEP